MKRHYGGEILWRVALLLELVRQITNKVYTSRWVCNDDATIFVDDNRWQIGGHFANRNTAGQSNGLQKNDRGNKGEQIELLTE